jgi:hypothetical protein
MSEERRDEVSDGYGLPEPIPYVPYTSPPQHTDSPPPMESGEPHFLPPVPPFLPPSMPAPGSTPARRRGRRRLWIISSIIAALLLIFISGLFVIRYTNRPTPGKTLDVFCNALQGEDYRSAYDQFSKKLQRTVSETTFASILSQDKIIACTHGPTNDSGNSTKTDLKLVHASKGINNDVVTLSRDSNNDWKIDDLYRQA